MTAEEEPTIKQVSKANQGQGRTVGGRTNPRTKVNKERKKELRKTGRNKLEGATSIVSFLLSPLFHRDRRSKSRSGTALRLSLNQAISLPSKEPLTRTVKETRNAF